MNKVILERYDLSNYYLKIRKFKGEAYLEIWHNFNSFLELQVPLKTHSYEIIDNTIIIYQLRF